MLVVDVGCGVGLCWNIGEACRSGSHICSSWYFPRFLFKGGSCMQMNIASLMVLDCMLTSLCTMLNWLGSIGCPVVVLCRCMG